MSKEFTSQWLIDLRMFGIKVQIGKSIAKIHYGPARVNRIGHPVWRNILVIKYTWPSLIIHNTETQSTKYIPKHKR